MKHQELRQSSGCAGHKRCGGIALVLVTAWLAVTGCYDPATGDCVVSCGVGDLCPDGMTCSDGLCARAGGACNADGVADVGVACSAEERRCGDEESILVCRDEILVPAEECPQSCFEGACVACVPGTTRCEGDELQGCSSAEEWEESAGCPERAPQCVLGACLPELELALGGAFACARTSDRKVRCWGSNSDGQLGRSGGESSTSVAPVTLFGELDAQRIAAGGAHACAVLTDGSVRCWGQNYSGQLGLGDRVNRGDERASTTTLPAVDLGVGRAALMLALGSRHSCALLAGGHVKCWGANSFGQLGLGDQRDRGGRPGEMGGALPEVFLGRGAAVVELAAGGLFTCARFADGRVKCWGNNERGQLGLNEEGQLEAEDTRNRGDGRGEMGDELPNVALPAATRAVAISAGYAHACALLDTGDVACWGATEGYQPNLGGGRGVRRLELAGAAPVTITAGANHTCVLRSDGDVLCWGMNEAGQLGVGDTATLRANTSRPVALGSQNGVALRVTDVHAGESFSCALLETNAVKCWGVNASAQLGIDDRSARGSRPEDMGDDLPSVPLGQ